MTDRIEEIRARWAEWGSGRGMGFDLFMQAPEDIAYLLAELVAAQAALSGAFEDASEGESYAHWLGRMKAQDD